MLRDFSQPGSAVSSIAVVTTAVPVGPIAWGDFCIQEQLDFNCQPNTCANSTLGQKEVDYITICCDGDIVDTSQALFAWPRNISSIDLENLVCCGTHGDHQGGIQPINPVQTACTEGTPTPLASLAATNTANAAPYVVTYTSASFGASGEVGNFLPTNTPYCLWANTKSVSSMSDVTVPAASIETPSKSAYCQDAFGNTLVPYTTTTSSYSYATPTQTQTAASATSSTSVASTHPGRAGTAGAWAVFGLLSILLLDAT